MLSRGRLVIVPAYLFACLILGGSAQGIWQNMILQLAGVGIIAWAAINRTEEPLAPSTRQLLLIGVFGIAVVAAQMVTLPATLWTHLGPREAIAKGFSVLGLRVPPEPLSLASAAGLDSLLAMIPPLAIFCGITSLKAYRVQWLAVALIAGCLGGIAIGAMQAASSTTELSPWYLYEETSNGRAVGFFANADHMATLLLVTIPFLAGIVAAAKAASIQRYSALIAVAAGVAILLVVGLALNGSLAGYGLALPVVAASALILLPPSNRFRLWIVILAALLVFGGVGVLESTAIGSGVIGDHATSSVQSRAELLSTTMRAARDFMPFGSGLGSFQKVYPLYETPELVTNTYAVHAHNDYAELILELGLAGLALIILLFAWWGAAVWRVWRTGEVRPFARAAAIASAAILVHSLVDFPLRTAAIAACFGMCLGLLADSRGAAPNEKVALRPKRHLEFK